MRYQKNGKIHLFMRLVLVKNPIVLLYTKEIQIYKTVKMI